MSLLAVCTAADRNFLWGAYLLTASLRRFGSKAHLHCLAFGFDVKDAALLEQFPNTTVTLSDAGKTGTRVSLTKPSALRLGIDADYTWWMDADCMVTGNVDDYLVPDVPSMSIRFRSPAENKLRFSRSTSESGEIPRQVQEIWQRDVGERESSRIETATTANAFGLHRSFAGFLDRWEAQVDLLNTRYPDGAPEQRLAYLFSSGKGFGDELILNSLLAFANDVPPFSEYRLDSDPAAMLIHFSLNPKPWQQWTPSNIRHYETLVSTIEWAKLHGYQTPPVPWHFDSRNQARASRQAWQSGIYYRGRDLVRAPLRYLLDITAARRAASCIWVAPLLW